MFQRNCIKKSTTCKKKKKSKQKNIKRIVLVHDSIFHVIIHHTKMLNKFSYFKNSHPLKARFIHTATTTNKENKTKQYKPY